MEKVKDTIYRQDAIDAINTWDKFGVDERSRIIRWHEGLEPYVHLRDVLTAIVNLPSAQPEIVRCKDCKHWKFDHTCREHSLVSPMMANEFCSRAERREDG